jgi:hypothetical protein
MLNKDICLRCTKAELQIDVSNNYQYVKKFNEDFDKGVFICYKLDGYITTKTVPKMCPYRLEHILAGQQE